MIVYLASGALALLCVMVAQRPGSRGVRSSLLWTGAFLALWAPAALRVNVGVDYSRYQGYRELFQVYARGLELDQGMDPGFVALVRGLAALGADAQWLFAVTSGVVVALTLRAARRLSDEPVTTVALFLVAGLYFESLNIIRQWIAIACVLNALAWVSDNGPGGRRSLLRYCCWVLAGSLFHETCLLWMAMWPVMSLLRGRMTRRRAVLLVAACVLVLFAAQGVARGLLSQTRFGRYLLPGSGELSEPDLRPDVIGTGLVMLGMTLWSLRREESLGEWDACLLCLQSIGVGAAVSGVFLPSIADRVVRYFVAMLLLQMPRALSHVDGDDLRDALRLAAVACWILVTFVRVVYGGQYGVLPYRCILFS